LPRIVGLELSLAVRHRVLSQVSIQCLPQPQDRLI
jgi:hypothetical protein